MKKGKGDIPSPFFVTGHSDIARFMTSPTGEPSLKAK